MLAFAGIDEVDKELITFLALNRIGKFPVIFSMRVNVAPDLDILVDKQELCIEAIKEINRVQDMEGYNVVDSWLSALSSRLSGSGTNSCLKRRR